MTIHQRLQDTKTRTLAHYSLADDQLDLRYGPDKWSVRFILHHLADAETVLFDRVRRVLSGEGWAQTRCSSIHRL